MPFTHPENAVDRTAVRAHFRRAATTCGDDVLTREVDRRMLDRLDYIRLEPRCVLDLGCGPNFSRSGLAARYPRAFHVGLDPLFAWKRGFWNARKAAKEDREISVALAGDAEALPFREGCADLVWANLLLPWLFAPAFLAEAWRCLAPGGLLMFSALGPDTLKELRGGFRDGYAHTQFFPDLHDLGDLLVSCDFSDPVVDMERLTLTYARPEGLIQDLRAAGAACAMRARRRGLVGRRFRDDLWAHYETFRREDRLPATFELLYGHAWKPEDALPESLPDGRAIIRFR